jgi:hypothetical protein
MMPMKKLRINSLFFSLVSVYLYSVRDRRKENRRFRLCEARGVGVQQPQIHLKALSLTLMSSDHDALVPVAFQNADRHTQVPDSSVPIDRHSRKYQRVTEVYPSSSIFYPEGRSLET